MNSKRSLCRFLAGAVLVFAQLLSTGKAQTQSTSWTNNFSGKWETPTSWDNGAPSSALAVNVSGSMRTVTVDSVTSGSFPSTMTVGSLNLWSESTLFLNNAGTATLLHILNGFTMNNNNTTLLATNSTMQVDSGTLNMAGYVKLLGGSQLVATNSSLLVLSGGGNALTISDGTILARDAAVGQPDGYSASLTLAGGALILSSSLSIGSVSYGWGSVRMTGGLLDVSNGTTTIGSPAPAGSKPGDSGYGNPSSLIVTGGTAALHDVQLNDNGTLILSAGSLRLSGVLSTSSGASNAAGTARFDGGSLVVESTGLLRLGTNIASVSSSVTNQGVVQVLASSFGFNGGLDNQGYLTVNNGQFITTAGNMGSSGQVTINGGGVLSVPGFVGLQTGSFFLYGGSALVVGSAWTNAGAVSLSGGSVISGGSVRNAGLIEGSGGVNAPVVNAVGGTIRANGGLLSLNSSSVQNLAGGVLESTAGSTLRINGALRNQGIINPQGGAIDLGANMLTNTGTMTGFGTYKAGVIVNNGRATFQGGNVSIQATYINGGGSVTEVKSASAGFFGAVTNNAGGIFKNTSSQITFFNIFYNNGSYISDPATNVFNATLALGPSGNLQGGEGDRFVINGDLLSANPAGLDVAGATLAFGGGTHAFTLAGTARIGTLEVAPGGDVQLSGGDLIVGVLNVNPNQITTARTIYYDPSRNSSLDGQTYALTGGGLLTAVPEPSCFALLLVAVGCVWMCRRKGQ